jgi:hypothetical protein
VLLLLWKHNGRSTGIPAPKSLTFFDLPWMAASKLCFSKNAAKPQNHMEVILRAVSRQAILVFRF